MGMFKSYRKAKRNFKRSYQKTLEEERKHGESFAQSRIDAIHNRTDNVHESSQHVKQSFNDMKKLPRKTLIFRAFIVLCIVAFIIIGIL